MAGAPRSCVHRVAGSAAGPALLLALALTSACGPGPDEVVRRALAAAEGGDRDALLRWVDPRYADGLGGREVVIGALDALAHRYARRRFGWRRLEIDRTTPSRARAEVEVELDLALDGGGPSVRLEGPSRVELVRDAGFRIRSGLLTELRDVLDLMAERRAALEANDADRLGEVLHPSYADGPYDRFRLIERVREDLAGVALRIEPLAYRIQLRPSLVHVDEHFRLTLNGETHPAQVARLTLARSAGRLRIRAGIRPGGSSSDRPDSGGPAPSPGVDR